MTAINMLEAKTHLSRLVDAIEQGTQKEIIIARNGRPVARLVPVRKGVPARRIGVAKGKFRAPEDIDAGNDLVAEIFGVAAQ
ncbi:MAG: type II toxin-antitoxin system prevent-host-death family antitoxin [Xanthomonadales bacterium]|nr:type II toxin-antitoxin system prevent-host-death family antitoxin [Xanthomonadales bacterium]